MCANETISFPKKTSRRGLGKSLVKKSLKESRKCNLLDGDDTIVLVHNHVNHGDNISIMYYISFVSSIGHK